MASEEGNGGSLAFFTAVDPNGMWVHWTVRQGATARQVDALVKQVARLSDALIEAGHFAVHEGRRDIVTEAVLVPPAKASAQPVKKAPAQRKTTQPGPQQQGGRAGWDSRKSPMAVAKLLITGEASFPIVEMRSPNPKLEYPIMKPPANLVRAILKRNYGMAEEETEKLGTPGTTMSSIQWMVQWVPSSKGNYKDLVDITVPKLADRLIPHDQREELVWEGKPQAEKPVDVEDIPF